MREIPILFSAPMVRSILDDRKWMTRRVVKPQPPEGYTIGDCHYSPSDYALWHNGGCSCIPVKCPYEVGARIWVKETWQALHFFRDFETGFCDEWVAATSIPVSSARSSGWSKDYWSPVYAAEPYWDMSQEERGFTWRPSIHMPRWASRIQRDVLNVRVERLQDITEEDAIAEGAQSVPNDCDLCKTKFGGYSICSAHQSPVGQFRALWDSINGKKYPWELNPWVWVVEFPRGIKES